MEQIIQVACSGLFHRVPDLVVHQGFERRLLGYTDHTKRCGESGRSHATQQKTQDRVGLVVDQEIRDADAFPQGDDLWSQPLEADATVLVLTKDHGLVVFQH